MAEFKLDRFKYNWKGEWATATVYNRDDVVRVKGKTYVCLEGHTAATEFRTDLNAILPGSVPPQPQPRWRVMTSSRSFRGTWAVDVVYDLGDIIFYDGSLYTCAVDHTALTFGDDIANWESFGPGIEYKTEWEEDTGYGAGALVKYNGIVYRCIVPHTSSGTLEENIDNWEIFHDGYEYRGAWLPLTLYRKNDLVKYGGSIFKVTETHTTSDGPNSDDESRTEIFLPGFQFEGDWSNETYYNIGDVALFRGYAWYAIDNNIDKEPDESPDEWKLFQYGYNYLGQYNLTQNYRQGDIVQRGGDLYISVGEVDQGDGSTRDFLDLTKWEKIKPGVKWNNTWREELVYYPNDIVYHAGSAWKCVEEHTSSASNFPGDNGSGFEYWETFIQAGIPAGMEASGDLLTFGLNRTEVGDGSTTGLTNVPIGDQGQLLSISAEYELFYRDFVQDSDVIYVSPAGQDEDGYGLDPEKPFKTIEMASDYAFYNYTPMTPLKIKVNTGRYEENLPIPVPAGCVVMGDELRSTTVVAANPDPYYANDWAYTTECLSRLRLIIPQIVTNTPITTSEFNTLIQDTTLDESDSTTTTAIAKPIDDAKVYVNFRLDDAEEDVLKAGSNEPTLTDALLKAYAIIQANINFIAEDFVYYYATLNVNADIAETRRQAKKWVRAIAYDILYPGNFRTLKIAEIYFSKRQGSKIDRDMFLLHDTTGLRQLTVDGMEGRLNPPGVFSLYQRPTGGSYCALDPGWGPADSRVWINNRSPYIQGVTTLGSRAIGQKIDGSLHAGGNKSFVSNDFTQVISDGIGAWVLNGARAELVSVFTYYAAIGYLAEGGGTIRATNGNCSYGKFGAISSGIDPDEIPKTAFVDNTNNEALVSSAFAGEFQDEIFLFEYVHCGEQYTQASGSVIGSGANARIRYDEFTDGSISQVRLLNEGSGAAGGSGYAQTGNNAQNGNTTQITLAQSDTANVASVYEEMRIIITSGDGTGQYGIIDTFNPISKLVTVKKESDGTPGWDHIVAGTAILSALSTNTVYRIEPRVVVSDPGFADAVADLPNAREWKDLEHGDTSQTFTGVEGSLGTGDTDESVTAAKATFNVDRVGSAYEVTIATGGAGYAVGDKITVSGTVLGGAAPTNNLTITVTATTEDSTNAISGFIAEGTGLSGKFVGLAVPNFVVYSTDGENWSETFLSEVEDWFKVKNGNGVFVIAARASNKIAVSSDGEEWTIATLPVTADWSDIAFGNGRFVLIANANNIVLVSVDGLNWTERTIDAGNNDWMSLQYGAGKFIAIAQDRAVAVSNSNATSWTVSANALPASGGDPYNFISLTYGKNRWLGIDQRGVTVQSVDNGTTWGFGAPLPSQDGSTAMTWNSVKYENGLWMGVCNTGGLIMGDDDTEGPTTFCITSCDGYYWDEREWTYEKNYQVITHANVNNNPRWWSFAELTQAEGIAIVNTGCRAKMRAVVTGSQISEFKIWDPGSGYVTDINDPVLTIIDNTFTSAVLYTLRRGNGVIGQPTFLNRGIGYRTSSTTVNISGDGFADIIPESNFVEVRGISVIPGPGTQIRFATIGIPETADPDDLKIFTISVATDLGDDGTNAGTKRVRFRITPSLEIEDGLLTGTTVELRENYSQCRISGHDFLDIGTGNFLETNYPDIYAGGNFFTASPENEVFEELGGRVFYVSTDQDGNFRAGELYSVEQATGIVTISAEFFQLDGLSELALGGVRLGGSGTVVREFSTDINFTEDSNNVIPTQRAIATFFNNRLSQGGSEIATNNLQAGVVLVGSEANRIDVAGGGILELPRRMNFEGDEVTNLGLNGTMLSNMFVFRST